ncbi:RNA polymerase sigma-70 factor (ECF subfamily) [Pseudonocardia eucalypti]|nr:RNA polymerase sigma-70 factor (ECF subfamily) [Pseudonocardia eucalypti]
MLGSVHEAEDLVQETYLRAWRAFDSFEGRSSVRTWLYRIATNACLTALEQSQRRPLPTGLGQPNSSPVGELESRPELPWLEPLPDSLVWGEPDVDPAEQAVTSDNIRLAFVAALQLLTPKQRAVLILRDVLAWRASEVAKALEISEAAVNSALQRARAQVAEHAPERPELPDDDRSRQLLDRYLAAFHDYNVDRIVELLTEDAVWEMPPFTGWFRGHKDIRHLMTAQCPAKGPGDMRLLPTSANGQPAFGAYHRGPDGVYRAFQLQQLSIGPDGIDHVACYFDLTLFAKFGLPEALAEE